MRRVAEFLFWCVFAVTLAWVATRTLGCAGTFKVVVDEEALSRIVEAARAGGAKPELTPEPDASAACSSPYALCIDGEPYRVRGVAYSPQEEESCAVTPYYEAVAFDDLEGDGRTIAAAGLNTIRVYSPVSRAIQTGDCRPDGSCWLDDRHLDALQRNGLRVIITISSMAAFSSGLHLGAAERYADHPAVLALQLGNEVNYSNLYSGGPIQPGALVDLTNGWAAELRAAGWSKPIILGWGHPAQQHREVLRRSNADVIAYQMYERLSFRTSNGQSVFDWHRSTFDGVAAAKRPGVVTEYGADSLDDGQLDEEAQAFAVRNLLELVETDAAREDGIAGGVIFSWSDNWGKASGDACTHDRTGQPGGSSGPHPDGIYHEEWWGLVRRDRTPRKAYYRVQGLLR